MKYTNTRPKQIKDIIFDKELAIKLIKLNKLKYEYLSTELKRDREIMLNLLKIDPVVNYYHYDDILTTSIMFGVQPHNPDDRKSAFESYIDTELEKLELEKLFNETTDGTTSGSKNDCFL